MKLSRTPFTTKTVYFVTLFVVIIITALIIGNVALFSSPQAREDLRRHTQQIESYERLKQRYYEVFGEEAVFIQE